MAQWIRECSVIVGDRKVEGLRIQFRVVKAGGKDPSTLDLHIYNLSAPTRAVMQTKGVPVILVAGYQGASQVIFSGDCRTIDHVRQGPEWVTHVVCGDGERGYDEGLSLFSFAGGVSVADVFERALQGFAGRVNFKEAVAQLREGKFRLRFQTYLQGYTAMAPTARELDRILGPHRITWSIRDGTLQLAQKGVDDPTPAVLLSPETGLIGSPDHGAPQKHGLHTLLRVQSLLNGHLYRGRKVRLLTASISGDYVTARVEHYGDSHGEEWTTRAELTPIETLGPEAFTPGGTHEGWT